MDIFELFSCLGFDTTKTENMVGSFSGFVGTHGRFSDTLPNIAVNWTIRITKYIYSSKSCVSSGISWEPGSPAPY